MAHNSSEIEASTDRPDNRARDEARPPFNLSVADPNIRIVAEIGAVTRQWQVAMDVQLRAHGLTHVRWVTLWRIAESTTMLNQTDLARNVGIESSTLVRQLDALEQRGLIERVVDTDRRARLIKLTPAAYPIIILIKDLATKLGREILSDVDPQSVAECATVLHTMRERLRDRAVSAAECPSD